MKLNGIVYGAVASALVLSNVATAAEFRAATVRSLGMGGSNVASANGVDASYWNPAAYGFFGLDDSSAENKAVDNSGMSDKAFGLELGGAAGLSIFGPIEDTVNTFESFSQVTGKQTGTGVESSITSAANVTNSIASLESLGANGFGNAGIGVRVSNYGVSANAIVDIGGFVEFDNANTKLDVFTTILGTATVPTGVTVATIQANANYFSSSQVQQMYDGLVSAKGGMSHDQAVAVIASYDTTLNANTSGSNTSQELADNLVTLATADGDINNNSSSWTVRGVQISEVGVTYGYAIDDSLSIGTTVKYLQADIFNKSSQILGTSVDTAALDKQDIESSSDFGIDVAGMYRMPSWQFGATVKNLNTPSFDHSSGYVYEMKPQVKVGAAWMPSDEFTLEAGLDLTENVGAIEANKSKYWNVGLEWDAWKVMAVRLGAFNNMSQSDIGTVATAGLGINLWAARLDLAAAMSTKTMTFEGDDIPTYLSASAALAIDF
ncbi:MAG: conjugal transfer protein TraF [Ghiorsea sp.]